MTYDEIYNYLHEYDRHDDIIDIEEDGLFVVIDCDGDWKHDHANLNYVMEGLGYQVFSEIVTEDDGSDWYRAEHTFIRATDPERLIFKHRDYELKQHREDLIRAYEWTKDETPEDTFKQLASMRGGYKWANIIVAEAVNASQGDGRISPETRKWAEQVKGSASCEEQEKHGLYSLTSSIHTSHLEQIAREARKVSVC